MGSEEEWVAEEDKAGVVYPYMEELRGALSYALSFVLPVGLVKGRSDVLSEVEE